jgi:hypothetical protein
MTIIKRVLSLIIFLVLMNAGVRVGMVYFRHQQFKDGLTEVSLFSGVKTDEVVRAQVMQLAAEHQIPLHPDFIEITRQNVPGIGDHSVIKVSYAVNVKVFPPPGKPRRFQFDYTTR